MGELTGYIIIWNTASFQPVFTGEKRLELGSNLRYHFK